MAPTVVTSRGEPPQIGRVIASMHPAPPPTRAPGLKARIVVAAASNERTAGLPRDFWLLVLGTFVNRAGTFVVPFLALYVTGGRGHSAATAGAVLLAYGVGGLPSQPVGGILADTIGRVRTASLALFASSVMLLLLAAARSPLQLMLAAGALGLVSDMFRPATSALIADIVPARDRARAFGLQFWAVNLGFAGAAVAGGFLAEIGWTWLFVGDAITTGVYGVILLRFVTEPPRVETAETPGLRGGLGIIGRDRLFLGFLLVALTYALMYSQVMSTLSVEVLSHGLTESDYGLILGLNGVVIVLMQPLLLGRIARWRPGRALAGAQVVVGIGLGLTALASSLPTFALTVVIWTMGEIVGATVVAPIVADLSPAHMRGRYQGIFGLSFSIAFAIGPALGLRVFDTYGGTPVWIGAFVAGLLSAAMMLRLQGGVAARREAAATTHVG